MCGIAGLFDPARRSGPERLARQAIDMAAVLAHRGPDAAGDWVDPDGRVAFAHRRLAVVDLTSQGSQPMISSDDRWVIVLNGEIYNHRDLAVRLSAEGVSFRGTSDTEVLLEAVASWGLDGALEAAEGMFAFGLWDRRELELHLARDRFGEKPLYYGWVGEGLAFASELKSLRCLPDFVPELDRDAVALFLRHNCIPAPRTVYRGIAKLEPGHVVSFGAGTSPGEPPRPRPYWSARLAIDDARARPLTGPDDVLVDATEAVLAAAVAARMVADVPVGAFLSGGVDSSLIVALMQQVATHPVRTFSVGFADGAFDESAEAAAVADHLGTDHTLLRVGESEAAAVIPQLPEIWDEPFADISQIPVHLVSRLARERVTVSLSGDAGDELFAGYNRHAWVERLWRSAGRFPDPARRVVGAGLSQLPPGAVDRVAGATRFLPTRFRVRNPSTKVAKIGRVLGAASPEDAYLALISHWDGAGSMVLGAGAGAAVASDPTSWPRLSGITEQMLWLDLVGYLPDDILTKVDRAAMAVSLETRVPFLDRAVVDLAWRLPMEAKLRDGVTKWVLRQVLYRHVPPALVDRPKMGFGMPIGSWLRGPLRPWAEEMLDERRLQDQGVLDPAPVRRAWVDHLSGRRDRGYELWDVLALQAWLERWLPSPGG